MARIDLAGKPIAITGASSGIGRATAIACARAGMPVAVGARRPGPLRALVEEISAAGGRALAVEMDTTRREDCRALVDETVRAFGSIYAVYANAGYGLEAAFDQMSDEQMRAIFETNFFGTLNVIRPALEHMKRARAGHVLVCSSCVSRFPLPYYGAYSATKAAQFHIARAMRSELRPFGIFVSPVLPTGTRTEFFDRVRRPDGSARSIEHMPAWLLQSADHVAQRTLNCLRRPRSEVWTSFPLRLAMGLCNTFPMLMDLGQRVSLRSRPGPIPPATS
ncbi:MAG: SDR family NAD(P)-dependent oxidoreductase [Phycisphaerae bacterium]|nr:SDR family NAD(P)-dependent oxidoreductase [Phycisphaerae bacterium]